MPEPTHPALAPLEALLERQYNIQFADRIEDGVLVVDLRAAIAEASALLGEEA